MSREVSHLTQWYPVISIVRCTTQRREKKPLKSINSLISIINKYRRVNLKRENEEKKSECQFEASK